MGTLNEADTEGQKQEEVDQWEMTNQDSDGTQHQRERACFGLFGFLSMERACERAPEVVCSDQVQLLLMRSE